VLHSNEQRRSVKDGDVEEGLHKPALQQKTTGNDCHTHVGAVV